MLQEKLLEQIKRAVLEEVEPDAEIILYSTGSIKA